MRRAARGSSAGAAVLLLISPASAAEGGASPFEMLSQHGEITGLAVLIGLTLFASAVALLHLGARKRWLEQERRLTSDLAQARAKLDRAQTFLAAEPQVVIAWGSSNSEPDIEGDASLVSDLPVPRRILGFGSWLPPAAAQALDHAVERLRDRGEGFRMALTTIAGRHLEADGRAVGGRAILRIRDASGDRVELTRLRERFTSVVREVDLWHRLFDTSADPAWSRDDAGRLTWVNRAYMGAVDAKDPGEVVAAGAELLDERARGAAAAARASGSTWSAQVAAVLAGERRNLDVTEVTGPGGSAGVGRDRSETESLRDDLRRQIESQAGTLDQLTTAVAIFDGAKRLVFYNAAYRTLWGLDAGFLDTSPLDNEILDRLRAERKLPEQADFRAWKAGVLAAYQTLETSETSWYLPDNRNLRVVTNPHPKGGVIYLFDDVTERYHLESRFNAAIREQSETLDALKEAVAVFGTDGRLKIFNTAFALMWDLDAVRLSRQPHIDAVADHCLPKSADTESWIEVRSIVAGLHYSRQGFHHRLLRNDGSVIDAAAAPLPNGATLLTFTDVTAGVNEERMLKERNEALMTAEKLRDDFTRYFSYELRSPLTTIIGFLSMLSSGTVGPLNAKQTEYVGYINKSSAALLAIINDILDLATIDKDAMALDLANVDIVGTMKEAAEDVKDRLAERDIHLQIVPLGSIGTFLADGKRLRQILFNLLSNAINFSEPGTSVTLAALRRDDSVVFKVTDRGRGIPEEMIDRVFDRFYSDPDAKQQRGLGLGLSIVRSLVELHGGKLMIDSVQGEGTVVTCLFPQPRGEQAPAQILH